MDWGRYIKRTAVRRVVWIVVGLAVYAALSAFGVAHAQANPCPNWDANTGTQMEAYSCAMQAVAQRQAQYHPSCRLQTNIPYGSGNIWGRYAVECQTGPHNSWSTFEYFMFLLEHDGCPEGSTFRDDLGRCFGDDECLNRNDNLIGNGNAIYSVSGSGNVCLDGCSFGPVGGNSSCASALGQGLGCSAKWHFTGAQCFADPPDDPPDLENPPQEKCVWFGGEAGAGGQAFCKKADGRECYTIQGGNRAGQQVCWAPGEAGRKVAGDTAITRGPGPNEPPQPDPPPGESMEKVGESVTVETTTNTASGSSTTTTTTRQDRTMYGTDAGGPGAPDQSEGPGSGGEGEGEGEGSWSGGNDCSAPPACSGDPIQCGIGLQVWTMRCEAGEDGEFGDWVSEIDGAIAAGDGDGDPDEGEMLDHADPDTWREVRVVDDEGLDDSGFGLDRSCPQLPAVQVGPTSLQLNLGPICSFLSALSGLVLALAYFVAAKIIAGVK